MGRPPFAGSFRGKLQADGRGGGLQAGVCRANGSKEQYFGLETEARPSFRSVAPSGAGPFEKETSGPA